MRQLPELWILTPSAREPAQEGQLPVGDCLVMVCPGDCLVCHASCLQEYLGSYVSDESGRLVFREGLLVQASRPALPCPPMPPWPAAL